MKFLLVKLKKRLYQKAHLTESLFSPWDSRPVRFNQSPFKTYLAPIVPSFETSDIFSLELEKNKQDIDLLWAIL